MRWINLICMPASRRYDCMTALTTQWRTVRRSLPLMDFIDWIHRNGSSQSPQRQFIFQYFIEARVRERVLLSNQISISHIEQNVVWSSYRSLPLTKRTENCKMQNCSRKKREFWSLIRSRHTIKDRENCDADPIISHSALNRQKAHTQPTDTHAAHTARAILLLLFSDSNNTDGMTVELHSPRHAEFAMSRLSQEMVTLMTASSRHPNGVVVQ